MTCGPEPVTFRLLDRDAGWTHDLVAGPAIAIDDVIALAALDPDAVDPDALAAAMPPPWVARGASPCEWYLACGETVLRHAPRVVEPRPPRAPDPCTPAPLPDPSCLGWVAIAGAGCRARLREAIAVTAAAGRIAILDAGQRALLVMSPGGERLIATLPTAARGPIALWNGHVVVADRDRLVAYDLVTLTPRALATAPGPIARMVSAAGVLWIAVETASGGLALFRRHDGQLQPGGLVELSARATPTSITAASISADGRDVVCLAIPSDGGEPRIMCVDRCGQPAAPPARVGLARQRAGTIATATPLDSGVARCVWHRVRIDLDLPPRTGATVSLATAEAPDAAIADEDWQHVDDPAAVPDFLVDQPPGRYLHLRIDLRGDGAATPQIRRIRIDLPRSTSATRLPGVYREDPVAADFLARFLATFDASIEDLDRVIERFPALLDPAGAPAEALAWIASFLDIALDPAWSEAARRSILLAAPELYRRRGTPWALSRAIELTTGVTPAIQELGGATTFARLAASRRDPGFALGQSRLFGAGRTRFRLAASALGAAPLRSHGDPDRDHLAATGWRVLVQLPASDALDDADALARLRALIDAQKPAHVVTGLRVGGRFTQLGIASAVGIDTRLGALPPSYLGITARLGRASVLAPGPARGGARLAIGTASAVSIQTVLL